jgi:ArsR family transcriptional regulator
MVESTQIDTLAARDRDAASLEVLQAIADPTRYTILQEVSKQCRCVCDLQDTVPIAPNLLSYHLKVLRDAKLVVGTRRGRWIDYSLAPGAVELMHNALPTRALVDCA